MNPKADVLEASCSFPGVLASDLAALTKPRIACFVLMSTLVGFILGSAGPPDVELLLHTLIGTAMAASGSSALNQLLERDPDSKMARTRGRPLPAGRLRPEEVHCFGVLLLFSGVFYLGMSVNWPVATLGALTAAVYLFLYTPLKRKSALNTVVGAVAGALPPVGGWVAAAGRPSAGAWALFWILYLWQFPHFLSIAWMHREDYARGGYRMLPVLDPSARRTGRVVVLFGLALLPLSLWPCFIDLAKGLYVFVAPALGLAFLGFGLSFSLSRTDRRAKALLLASLVFLPVLWLSLILDRIAG